MSRVGYHRCEEHAERQRAEKHHAIQLVLMAAELLDAMGAKATAELLRGECDKLTRYENERAETQNKSVSGVRAGRAAAGRG